MRRKVLNLSRYRPESFVGRALRLRLAIPKGLAMPLLQGPATPQQLERSSECGGSGVAIRERAEPLLRDVGYGHGATCAFARCQRVLRMVVQPAPGAPYDTADVTVVPYSER